MTKEEWVDWKTNEVTQQFMEMVAQRIEDSKEILAETAGIDPSNDNFHRGFIAAMKEVVNLSFEDAHA